MGLLAGTIGYWLVGLVGVILGVAVCWIGINFLGFFENSKIEAELRAKLGSEDGELIGFVFDRPADALDAHAEVGLLQLSGGNIRIATEERSLNLRISSIRREPNIHSLVGLGGWIRAETDQGSIKIESRKHPTMFASARETNRLAERLKGLK